jgi:hypothetical protein
MTNVIAADTKSISTDTSLVKEYTMKIVEQLAKQDEILEQIAWIRAVVTQKSSGDQDNTKLMDGYFDSMAEYAGSACGDSVSDDVAEEMRRVSLDISTTSGDSSSTLVSDFDPIPFPSDDKPESMTIVIGNTHRLVTPKPNSTNKHLWTFYLQSSGEEIIQEARVNLVSIPYNIEPSKLKQLLTWVTTQASVILAIAAQMEDSTVQGHTHRLGLFCNRCYHFIEARVSVVQG